MADDAGRMAGFEHGTSSRIYGWSLALRFNALDHSQIFRGKHPHFLPDFLGAPTSAFSDGCVCGFQSIMGTIEPRVVQFGNSTFSLTPVPCTFLPGSGHISDLHFRTYLHETRLDTTFRLLDLGQPAQTPGMVWRIVNYLQQLAGDLPRCYFT